MSKAMSSGANKIAFVACDGCSTLVNGDVHVINSDGSGLTRLTTTGHIQFFPRISADGNWVVYATPGNQVFLIKSDGTGQTQLNLPQCADCQPLPNADGTQVAFLSYDGTTFKINVANVSGSQSTVVTDVGALGQPFAFTWSADAQTVVYTRNSGVSIINVDGTGLRPLESEGQAGTAGSPSMTFDGSVICYERFLPGVNVFVHDVFGINADGTNRRNLTNTPDGTDSRGFPLTSISPSISHAGNVVTFLSTADLDPGKNTGHLTQVFAVRLGP
jgi:Tol biopolymer transport system component